MKTGILNIFLMILVVVFFPTSLFSQEKVILEILEPTFEEDPDIESTEEKIGISKIKSKGKKKLITNRPVVNLRALDKITAKTSDIDIIVGEKKKFGYLEIFPKKCTKSQNGNKKEVVAYIQV